MLRMSPLTKTDAKQLIDQLRAQTGHRLTFVGMPALGATAGAAFVRWPDGRAGVLARCAEPPARLEHTAEILTHLRAHGVPAPRYDLIVELPDCTALVQERLPGEPTPRHIDEPMMAAILSMAAAFAGQLADYPDVPLLDLRLDESRTDSLARYDDRSRRLLDWIREVESRGTSMTGTDLIHRDYHRDNILFDGGSVITGIVDWHDPTNLLRGDWRYHLVNLAFDFAWALGRKWNIIDPAAMRLLDDALGAADPALLDACWARNALELVDTLIQREWHPDAGYALDYALTRVP